MILSVSRRTDIPAFYAEWFLDRLKKETVTVANPFNAGLQRHVSLKKEDVEAIVFWTRNPHSFSNCLDFIDRKGIPYYFLFTVNDYPACFEPERPDLHTVISALKQLYGRIGKQRIIWRYDPIVLSPGTPVDFHKRNFSELAQSISPFSFRVIVSFLDWYPKVTRRFKQKNIPVQDIREYPGKIMEITEFAKSVAEQYGLEIQSCAEGPINVTNPLRNGKCIDEQLLNRLFGLNLVYKKDRHQRPYCRCHQSVDIGTYKTCRFRCLYCYAC